MALPLQVGFNKLPVIKVLLAAGADVSLTDNRGNTPLHYAAGERLVVEQPIKLREAVVSLGNFSLPAYDCSNERVEFCMISTRSGRYYACLICVLARSASAGYGRKDAAELLLGAGAEVEALNNDQQSPADAAKVCAVSAASKSFQARGTQSVVIRIVCRQLMLEYRYDATHDNILF